VRLVKIGTAAISVKVGDFALNSARLRQAIDLARAEGIHLLVTPELAISGYSLEDRVLWDDLVEESWRTLEQLALHTQGIAVWVGLPIKVKAMLYNAAALLCEGTLRGLVLKKHLPTYSVFYEARNWSAWAEGWFEYRGVPAGDVIFDLPFGTVSAEICEDLWSPTSTASQRVRAGAEIVANLSASPFLPGKNEMRKRLIYNVANTLKVVYAYANLLGCDNSRLVFDGGGIIADPEGIVAEGALLSQEYVTLTHAVVDLDDVVRVRTENTTWRSEYALHHDKASPSCAHVAIREMPFKPAPLSGYVSRLPKNFFIPLPSASPGAGRALEDLFQAVVLAVRDYFEKVGAFKKMLVALSGGRDSALCLLIAVEAAKALRAGRESERFREIVEATYLPNTRLSSRATREAARALAQELGVPFRVFPIDAEVRVALRQAAALAGGEEKVSPLARQNLQARIRGAMMLNWANNVHGLLLVTSNLSEAAVGYTTTGGDNEGGYSPIANLPKTVVNALLEYLADTRRLRSIQKILAFPPSAELTENQEDEKDLMPYVVLDDLLYLYARQRYSLADAWKILCLRHPNHPPETLRTWVADFARRFAASQWKRDQHPVATKVLELDLDPKTGFRFPVTQGIEYELEQLAEARLD